MSQTRHDKADVYFGPFKKMTWMKALETRIPWSPAFCFNWLHEKADFTGSTHIYYETM